MNRPLRLGLVFGTLKIATYLQLTAAEHGWRVPMRKLGRWYFIWQPRGRARKVKFR